MKTLDERLAEYGVVVHDNDLAKRMILADYDFDKQQKDKSDANNEG